MSKLLVIACVLGLAALCFAMPTEQRAKYHQMFQNFKKQYGKQYASAEEEAKRFKIFEENMKKAEQLRKSNPNAVFGANEFADMSEKEFKTYHNGDKFFQAKLAMRKSVPMKYTQEQVKAAARTIDWRQKGAVTGVKNQGQCGSCWAFSTTGGIEGQWFLAGNPLTSLSEQELVSCDTIDQGCGGGLMDNAFQWLLQAHNGTIVTEASYPYVSGDGNVPACSMNGKVNGATIYGSEDLPHDEGQMATWVYSNGPLSIAVDATSWQSYMGGILTNCISNQIDHGVLIVGFDDTNNPPYWIVKNSWGTSWGENGYIRVGKGSDQCLITSDPCTSKVHKGTPGPGTTTTQPPTPGNDFEQKKCKDPKCTDCTVERIPQNKCINGPANSYKAVCILDGLLVTTYSQRNCAGTSYQTVDSVDVCNIIFNENGQSFLMNSCKKSGPTNPPTTTTTTTAAPANQTFSQMQCSDAQCTQGCQSYTFPQNVCLQTADGASAIAVCVPQGLQMTEYPLSTTCTGPSVPSTMPINQCLQDQDGTYFENICNNGNAKQVSGRTLRKIKKMQ